MFKFKKLIIMIIAIIIAIMPAVYAVKYQREGDEYVNPYHLLRLHDDVNIYGNKDGDYLYNIIDGKAYIIGYNGFSSNASIPREIDGYQVFGVKEHSFCNAKLRTVSFPDELERLSYFSFPNNYIDTITFNDKIKFIGPSVFRNNNIENVIIPDAVHYLGYLVFTKNKIENIDIPHASICHENAFDSDVVVHKILPDSYIIDSSGLEYHIKDNKAVIIGYLGNEVNLTIPGSMDGYPVEIGDFAFYNDLSAEGATSFKRSYVLEEGITAIGDYAFYDNFNSNITIPSSVQKIGNYAFYKNNLTEVNIPEGITEIGDGAFEENELQTITLPSTLTKIGSFAFSINKINALTIPNGVTEIGAKAFSHNKITELNIPDSVVELGDGAFSSNEITSVTLPSSLRKISTGLLTGNEISSITIPFTVVEIKAGAFFGNNLSEVILPDNLEKIGDLAFGNNNIQTVEVNYKTSISNKRGIANSGTIINKKAFSLEHVTDEGFIYEIENDNAVIIGYNGELEDITIPHSIDGLNVVKIGNNAFNSQFTNKVLNSVTLSEGIVEIGKSAFAYNNLTEIIIPNTVQLVDEYAFFKNNFTSITIGENVRKINKEAFSNMTMSTMEVSIPYECEYDTAFNRGVVVNRYGDISIIQKDGFVYQVENGEATLVSFTKDEEHNDVVIPSEINGYPVTKIGELAFLYSRVELLELPEGVKHIAYGAFLNNRIETVVIPNSVETIGENAFVGNKIEEIILPFNASYHPNSFDEVVHIMQWEDFNADHLLYEEIEGGLTITGYDGLCKEMHIPETIDEKKVLAIQNEAFKNKNIDVLTLPEGLERIGKGTFKNNNIKELMIPNTVLEVGYEAFMDNQVEELTLSNNMIFIEDSCFQNNKIKMLKIPSSVMHIMRAAFENNLIESVEFSTNNAVIGDGAFYHNLLTEVNLDSMWEVGKKAFQNNNIERASISMKLEYQPDSFDNTTEIVLNEVVEDNNLRFEKIKGGLSLIEVLPGYTSEELVIPDSINGEDVIRIGNMIATHEGDKKFKGIQLPKHLKSIGYGAFVQNQFNDLIIPNGVTNIGHAAFIGCQINHLTMPSSVRNIGVQAFDTNNIASVNLPVDVMYITKSYTGFGNASSFDSTVTIHFMEGQYNITVENGTSDLMNATAGEIITVTPNDPSEGKVFDQWIVHPEDLQLEIDEDNIAQFTMPESDVQLKATYKPQIFTVEFYDKDGNQIGETQNVPYQGSATAPESPEVEGYTFVKWDTDFTNVKDHLVVTGIYEKKTFAVRFYDKDGNQIGETQNVPYQESATAPELPVVEGYTFLHWEVGFAEVTEDIDVYSIYEKNTYTVKFLDQEGNQIGETQYIQYQDSATAPTAPEVEGYTFIGWDKAFNSVTKNLEINALYEKKIYTVKFLDKDGNQISETQYIQYQESAIAPDAPNVEGYTFTGWDKAFNSVIENLEINALYEKKTYTVKFLDKDGNQIGETQNIPYQESAIAPTAPEVVGYKFIAWDKNYTNVTANLIVNAIYAANTDVIYTVKYVDEADNEIADSDILVGTTGETTNAVAKEITGYTAKEFEQEVINADGTTVVVIQYTKNIYTVKFLDKEGDQIGETQNIPYQESAIAPTAPEVEGYTFIGWDKAFNSVTKNLEINALYEKKTYTVKFLDKDGNQIGETQNVKYQESATAPEAPNVEGYTFTGWDKAFDSVTKNLEINALYEKKIYTVKFLDKDGNQIGETQNVLYQGSAIAPTAPEVVGYRFIAWDKNYTNVTANLIVNAIYAANTDVIYTVKYVDEADNEIADSNILVGTTGETTNAVAKEITGYTAKEFEQEVINADGTTVVVIQYTKNIYTVKFLDKEGDQIGETQNVPYQESAIAPTAPEVEGYTFIGWDKAFNSVTKNLEINALYEKKTFTVKFLDKDGNQIGETQTVKYKESAIAPTVPSVSGYTFTGWDKAYNSVISDLEIRALYTATSNSGSNSEATTVYVPVVPKEEVPKGVPTDSVDVTVEVTEDEANIQLTETVKKAIKDSIEANGEVTLDISDNKEVKKVNIPKELIDIIEDDELAIEFNSAKIKLDSMVMDTLDKNENISLSVDMVKKSELTKKQQKALGGDYRNPVVDINIYSGTEKITTFDGGKIKVTIPYELKEGENASNIKVWYIKDNGDISYVISKYNEKTKSVEFTTNHLSKYVLAKFPFTDLVENNWAYSSIAYVYNNELLKGVSETSFAPNKNTTRAMLVTILYRLSGEKVDDKSMFKDVKKGQWYTDAINWALKYNIVKGFEDGTFRPNENLTREQFITILYRYSKIKSNPLNIINSYSDSKDVSSYAKDAMNWAVQAKIVNGHNNKLLPKNVATRAQMAVILKRFIEE